MITTSPTESDMRKAYEASVNAYVVKPMDFADLRSMLEQVASFWCHWNQTPQHA
jgi:AmiR/NasT family two-component response regulator